MDVIERKINCSREFTRILIRRLGERLFRVVLFGSVAKGLGDVDSDVDLLVIVDHVTDDVRRIVAEAAFEASIISREPIEYIVMGLEEYRMRGIGDVFIYEVESHGKVLYHDSKPEEEMVKKLMELADEYYNYSLRCMH
jgi:predicted nucleotidyltransferase